MNMISGFLHALEVIEAASMYRADMRKETYNETNKPLLAPTIQNFKDAETFVEMAKERFPSMVMKCYVLDCPPGKGLYDTSGGNKCKDCTVGSTFSEYTDAEECQDNVAKCAAGSGLAPSTSASVDATCPTCTEGRFSTSNDGNACAAFTVREPAVYNSCMEVAAWVLPLCNTVSLFAIDDSQ